MRPPVNRTVRARQRDRATSLPGFDRDFAPQTREWGIEKLQLKITGRWRTSLGSGPEFFAQRLSDQGLASLRRPEHRGSTISVESVHPSPLTISRLKITAMRCNGNDGALVVDLSANPTRTLASLIARFGQREDFRAHIFTLSALTFFGLAAGPSQAPPSLDGGDNYLPERPAARQLIGDDPFAAFMPIYIMQVQALLSRVLSENDGGTELDGGEQVVRSLDGLIRLDWNSAAVPQIETYFERFHRNAVVAVRGAATSLLDADTATRVTLYPAYQTQPSLERSADALSLTAAVALTVDNRHILSVYAKTPSRIRFEVRRHSRGRYSSRVAGGDGLLQPEHTTRLLHILLNVERHDASRLILWSELFGFFQKQDVPTVGDLAHLMNTVFQAANGSAELFNLLTERLMIDGGLSVGVDERITRAAVTHLERAGVIERGRIRHRHTPPRSRAIASQALIGRHASGCWQALQLAKIRADESYLNRTPGSTSKASAILSTMMIVGARLPRSMPLMKVRWIDALSANSS